MSDLNFAASASLAPSAVAGATQSFEQAMERLEGIVGQMENSKLPLEDLIRCYEEGTRLVKVCNERLAAAEQRIEIITRDAGGVAQQPAGERSAGATPVPRAIIADSKPTQEPPASPERSTKKSNEVSLF